MEANPKIPLLVIGRSKVTLLAQHLEARGEAPFRCAREKPGGAKASATSAIIT